MDKEIKERLMNKLKNIRPPVQIVDELIEGPIIITPDFNQTISSSATDKYGNLITYNSKQLEFISAAASGKDCVLLGAAGTGKTTCMKGTVTELIQSGKAGILDAQDHKYLISGTPGIAVVAYTRRAVANIRRNMPDDMKNNCITIHKLLEYEPQYYDVEDPETGETKTKMKFCARRGEGNPLPSSIHTIIFEEASMLGIDLYREVRDACPHKPQEIFLGDIQQLPPVFGPAILGFKLLTYTVVELTEVYRQALESPIISLAHRILSGNGLPSKEFQEWKKPGQLTIHPWKKKLSAEDALSTAAGFFFVAENNNVYDPNEDIILLPFNKAFGTDELNKKIANHLAKKAKRDVYEILAGFNKHYYSIGDKVMYEKEDATIVNIYPTVGYTGKFVQPHSQTLDYWGYNSQSHKSVQEIDDDAVDFLLAQVAEQSESEDRVKTASHTIVLRMTDSEQEIKIDKAGDINSLMLGYALTVHKSQGSEWRKVFIVFHQSHATMLQRELLYTAVTRAKEELYIICEPESFENGIKSQRVKGNSLKEKAEFFKGKLDKEDDYKDLI